MCFPNLQAKVPNNSARHAGSCCFQNCWQSRLFLCTPHVTFPCWSIMFRNSAPLVVSRVSRSHSLRKKQYQCPYLGWCHKWLHSILPKRQSASVANSSFTPDDTILAMKRPCVKYAILSPTLWSYHSISYFHFGLSANLFSDGRGRSAVHLLASRPVHSSLIWGSWIPTH